MMVEERGMLFVGVNEEVFDKHLLNPPSLYDKHLFNPPS
jgi:hypothetical protein